MASQAHGVTGGDVFREIIEIESFLRSKIKSFDRMLVDGRVGLSKTHIMRENPALKVLENLIVLKKPADVHGIGVGEKNELNPKGFEERDDWPHCPDRMED